LWNFIDVGGNFSTANITVVSNLQGFFNRYIFIDSTSGFYVTIAVILLLLYYYLIYRLVWKYCKKYGKAKWTWTLLVVFGPTIFFVPPYIFFAIYVFRQYFFRFIYSIVEEYKAFNPGDLAEAEAALLEQENLAAIEREKIRKEKSEQKAIEKVKSQQQKAEQRAIDQDKRDKESEELKIGMSKQKEENKKIRDEEKAKQKVEKEKLKSEKENQKLIKNEKASLEKEDAEEQK